MDPSKAVSLSRLTCFFGIYIVVSASFMRQVQNWLYVFLGQKNVFLVYNILFALVVYAVFIYIFRKRLAWIRVLFALGIFGLAWDLVMRQPFLTEQVHVLTYGILGALAARDLVRQNAFLVKIIVFSIIVVTVVSFFDELFQAFLSYRSGDIRDVVTNILGGALGVLLSTNLLYTKRATPR